ncbi:MAG: tetratricopeptide repeat protein, partial [Melioribacteraceae bacterium]
KYASLCLKYKEYERAIEALEFLTQKSPDVINYWLQLSSAYDKSDKTDKALSAYKRLIELQPDNKDNYANIALIYKKMDQLSVARTYLQKASNMDPNWDFPYFVEAQLYEQAARNCIGSQFEFIDKAVYQLAVDTYRTARSKGGSNAGAAAERMNALKDSVPQQEDYFFRKIKSGDKIKIEGKCYDWIGRTIVVP